MSHEHNQFDLLREKRYLPFFITQALGALNDNVFKNALVILITYTTATKLGLDAGILVNLAAILFILPFFLFSAIAGQLADKYEKSRTMRYIKKAEIVIMALAVIGFYLDNTYWLLFVLFLMGFQSAIFGPLKFGYLPQHLHTDELVGGNALVESGTFLAILFGTIIGGVLIALEQYNLVAISITIIFVAIAGYAFSRKIPETPAVDPTLKVNWNIVTESYRNLKFTRNDKTVFLCILGISWFWFYGAVFLAQIPNYTKGTLAGSESVATLFLTAFSLGIGIGAMICEKLSAGRVEAGLVPIGAIGLSVFSYDLYLANQNSGLEPIYGYLEFLQQPGAWRVLTDATFIGMFGGLFTVPLYAMIQQIGNKAHMSRLFAGLNIMNALFMVISGVYAIIILQAGFTIPQLFAITSAINILVAIYIFFKAPEFIFRFITWLLVNTIYRIRNANLQLIPKHGAAVLVCNHVSFIDALIIAGYCKRNIRFVMYHKIFKAPIIGAFFKMANAIPISPAHEDEALMQSAFDKIAEELEAGKVVCIFPEGKLTPDGEIGEFKPGIEKIIQRTPVPVYPLALEGLWGTWFSRINGTAMKGLPKKFMAKVHLVAGEPVNPEDVTAPLLQQKVAELKASAR
ncbi:MFS transporter [Aliikangiella marina]|uniref:MFS transporter n=1 Tax=Aliikangiella marina TaxID=1712262 RepID=A0A545TBX5_9GAMM|nr:MFS transporter [Aliikangiella marina]TQV74725.1 MFS transporter [Aliikangiella marina]